MRARSAVPLLLALAAFATAWAAEGERELTFARLNRTYSDFVRELAPVGEPGMTVRLTSPHQVLLLRDHRIRLRPEGGGIFAGAVELEVQGKGSLVADVELGPLVRQLTDEVIVPPQTIRAAGRARIRRVTDGYEISALEAPHDLRVAIQSRTINDILTLCDQAALLTLGALDCSGFESALTRPAIPVPEGSLFHLGDDELTAADRSALDALLANP